MWLFVSLKFSSNNYLEREKRESNSIIYIYEVSTGLSFLTKVQQKLLLLKLTFRVTSSPKVFFWTSLYLSFTYSFILNDSVTFYQILYTFIVETKTFMVTNLIHLSTNKSLRGVFFCYVCCYDLPLYVCRSKSRIPRFIRYKSIGNFCKSLYSVYG